jgi:hypothetical protein
MDYKGNKDATPLKLTVYASGCKGKITGKCIK